MPRPQQDAEAVVVKVGGSLYDLPDLGPRLRDWLKHLEAVPVLVVPYAGDAAELAIAPVVLHFERRMRYLLFGSMNVTVPPGYSDETEVLE